MQLTDQDVAEFRRLYKNCYGDEMAIEEARMRAIRLMHLYRLLFRIRPEPFEQLAKSGDGGTVEVPPANSHTT